jgi:hypothetical protein
MHIWIGYNIAISWEIAKSRKNLNYIYALRDMASNVEKTQWISITILTI